MLKQIVQRFVNPKQCNLKEGIETLDRLKELTNALDFSTLAMARSDDPTVVDLRVESGSAQCIWVYDTPKVSVARAVFEDGTFLKNHTHKQFEAWVIYSGYLEVVVDGVRVDNPKKIVYYVYPGSEHSVRAIGETEIIVISVPRSPDFPHWPELDKFQG